jgi:hypothetical protein
MLEKRSLHTIENGPVVIEVTRLAVRRIATIPRERCWNILKQIYVITFKDYQFRIEN